MKKIIFTSAVLFFCMEVFFSTKSLAAPNVKLELKTTEATLSIDKKGDLSIIQTNGEIQVKTSINNLWEIILKNTETNKEIVLAPDEDIELKKSDEGIELKKGKFLFENNVLPIEANFTISVKNNAFCFSGTLQSNTDEWIFKELKYPDFSQLVIKNKEIKIYWPNSLGECFDNPEQFGTRSFQYPGTSGSMAWFSVNTPKSGIYIGGHDPQMGSKTFQLDCSNTNSYRTSLSFPIYNAQFKIPDVFIKLYGGDWHVASLYYRDWYDKNFQLAKIPQWMRDNAGLVLNILKQQNGSVMWSYKDIDRLCDIGEKLNLNLIGLWGWAIGGHDRLYPNYAPDNLMGGRMELEKAIKRAQQRGFKVICYSNGTIMDTSTDYYLYNGKETLQLTENSRPNIEYYLKHTNTTPVVLARACPGSALWRKTIMDLASNAQSLGMDAFYIDQVGVRSPVMCFADNHEHGLPQEAYTKYRFQMMKEVRNKMQETDPEFPIITEGTVDALLPYVDAFHGLGPGQRVSPNGFPELFRYTFPESIIIQLNSSPAMKRSDVNFASVYGLRHEIMCRYEPDADYLRSGKIPTKEDYKNYFIKDPPDLNTITDASAKETELYAHSIIQFENDNSIFFRNGKFIDQEGINVSGNDILAKGFVNGKKIGVVLWNQHLSEQRNFSISVPGYKLIKSSEPNKPDVNANSPLVANSLRLLIFEKN